MSLDIEYDFRLDASGKDPDRYSKKLKEYHRLLWSNKRLPFGNSLNLDASLKDKDSGIRYSSDSVIHTYIWAADEKDLSKGINKSYYKDTEQCEKMAREIGLDSLNDFMHKSYTIGGMMMFPGEKKNGLTINQARGTNSMICDRFDLTLECIRLHYLNIDNPLENCLDRYRSFFDLFVDFHGFIDFFLLQDIVKPDDYSVRFMLPFCGFVNKPLPKNAEEYYVYMDNCIRFIDSRNKRVSEYKC